MADYLRKPFALLALAAALLTACGSAQKCQRGEICAAVVGEAWPYTVPSGRLICRNNVITGDRMVTLKYDGIEYALNGGAENSADRFGFQPMEAIYRTDENGIRLAIDLASKFIDQGLTLCS